MNNTKDKRRPDSDTLIGPREICALLGISGTTFHGDSARRGIKAALPEPVMVGQRRKWWRSDVLAAADRGEARTQSKRVPA